MSEVKLRKSPSYPRLTIGDDGTVIGPSGKTLKTFVGGKGYRCVTLYVGERRWVQLRVHFLVCEAFHGSRPTGAHVAHGDGDRLNNRARNLRWATGLENEADKRRHGRSLVGERHHQSILTEAQVTEIREAHAAGESVRSISGRFPTSYANLCLVAKGRTWGHLS